MSAIDRFVSPPHRDQAKSNGFDKHTAVAAVVLSLFGRGKMPELLDVVANEAI